MSDFNYTHIPTVTTRLPRNREVNGVDRIFIKEQEFVEKHKQQKLICVSNMFGNWYGSYVPEFIKNKDNKIVTQLRYDIVNEFKQHFKNICTIYIKPVSLNKCFENLNIRNLDKKEYSIRIEELEKELNHINTMPSAFDFVFTNDFSTKSSKLFSELINNIQKNGY